MDYSIINEEFKEIKTARRGTSIVLTTKRMFMISRDWDNYCYTTEEILK